MSGTGWTCTLTPSLGCTRSDALAAGASYPAITLTVSVAANAPASVTNTAAVTGGGNQGFTVTFTDGSGPDNVETNAVTFSSAGNPARIRVTEGANGVALTAGTGCHP